MIPPGEGAWAGKPSHPEWNQATEIWAACSSLCNLAATVERLMRDLEAVARQACPKELLTAFRPSMPTFDMLLVTSIANVLSGISSPSQTSTPKAFE